MYLVVQGWKERFVLCLPAALQRRRRCSHFSPCKGLLLLIVENFRLVDSSKSSSPEDFFDLLLPRERPFLASI